MGIKDKKYHFLYKTTNILNKKYYIGIHSTYNLDDGYLGSGLYLRRSIEKYGKENFKIEYLEFFESKKLLVDREKQIVNEELIKNPFCMNLKPGGIGGFVDEDHEKVFKEASKKTRFGKHSPASIKLKELRNDTEWQKIYSEKVKNGLKQSNFDCKTFLGKTHTDESKVKMKKAKKGKYTGKNNPSYGKVWMYHLDKKDNIKVSKDEITEYESIGYIRGRVNVLSNEIKQKISKESSNSIWICNIKTNKTKMIKKDDPIPNGWMRGRKVK